MSAKQKELWEGHIVAVVLTAATQIWNIGYMCFDQRKAYQAEPVAICLTTLTENLAAVYVIATYTK